MVFSLTPSVLLTAPINQNRLSLTLFAPWTWQIFTMSFLEMYSCCCSLSCYCRHSSLHKQPQRGDGTLPIIKYPIPLLFIIFYANHDDCKKKPVWLSDHLYSLPLWIHQWRCTHTSKYPTLGSKIRSRWWGIFLQPAWWIWHLHALNYPFVTLTVSCLTFQSCSLSFGLYTVFSETVAIVFASLESFYLTVSR